MGEWVSGSGAEDQPSLFYEAARSLLKPEVLESGSINSVQAFLLVGNYLQKTDRPNTGYNYLGLALRLAMGLGLHHELPATSPATQVSRHRRRILFWVLYCFDSWFNITTGRPSLLSEANFDVRIPHNVEEEMLDSSQGLADAAGPTSCSVIIALARLTKIANKVYNELICEYRKNRKHVSFGAVSLSLFEPWQILAGLRCTMVRNAIHGGCFSLWFSTICLKIADSFVLCF